MLACNPADAIMNVRCRCGRIPSSSLGRDHLVGHESNYGPYRLVPGTYVIRLPDAGDHREHRMCVEKLGHVDSVPGHLDLLILTVDSEPTNDSKDAWKSVYNTLGDCFRVYPVVKNEEGSKKYPTGSIVVRFPDAPGDEDLQEWARNHELLVKERNDYVPKQVSFVPSGQECHFLPEVFDSVRNDPDLRVWLDTLSSYRR